MLLVDNWQIKLIKKISQMEFIFGENALESVYAWTIPFLAIIILSEMIFSHFMEAKLYSKKDLFTNIYFALLNKKYIFKPKYDTNISNTIEY